MTVNEPIFIKLNACSKTFCEELSMLILEELLTKGAVADARSQTDRRIDGRGLFLGAFAKLRKATVSHVMCVRPSAWNNSAPTGRIFMKFDI
jgi:hypothetical protein